MTTSPKLKKLSLLLLIFLGFLSSVKAAVSSVSFTVINQTCPTSQDGSITATPNDGIGPFTYSWVLQAGCTQGQNLTSQTVTQVCSGEQGILITDLGDGSTNYFTSNMGPTPIAVIINSPEITNITCPGGADGQMPPRVFGGTGPYSFSWDNGSTDSVLTNVPAGTYVVTVTDANGCVAPSISSGTITEPAPIVITPLAVDLPLCGGSSCTEDVTFTAAGGNGGPFVISGINPVLTAPVSLVDICPGSSFEVSTTDIAGCVQTLTHTATTPQSVVAVVTVINQASCLSALNGQASVSGAGGTPPYLYNWYDVLGTPTTSTVSSLSFGTYNAEVVDQNGCSDTGQVVITSPVISPVVASAIVTNLVTCLTASNGEATASGAGGTPGYSFEWYDVPSAPITTATIGSLQSGTYNVEVKDQDGCVDTAQVIVTASIISPVVVSFTVSSICTGDLVADVQALASGGTAPYAYKWIDPVTGNANNNVQIGLTAGSYDIEVMDQDGCTDTAQATITAKDPLLINLGADTVNILGDSITLRSGYESPLYSNTWNNGAVQDSLIVKSSGSYSVMVTELSSGCSSSDTIVILQVTSSKTTISKELIKLYPNPASTSVEIVGNVANYFITDILGNIINNENKGSTIDLSSFQTGLYFIHARLKNGETKILRLVKK